MGNVDEVLEEQLDLLEVLEALEDAVEDGHNRLCVFRPRLRGAGAHATGRGEKIARIYTFQTRRIRENVREHRKRKLFVNLIRNCYK